MTPGPFPDFWVGPGDEASSSPSDEEKPGNEARVDLGTRLGWTWERG